MIFEDTLERRICICKKKNISFTQNNNMKEKESYKMTNTPRTVCYYTDIQLGLYIIRGDSIVLMGEVDNNDDDNVQEEEEEGNMIPLSLEDFETLQEEQSNQNKKQETTIDTKMIQDQDKVMTNLTWDFDTDLVV